MPAGVLMLKRLGSGIEWVKVIKSISNGPKLILLLSGTIFK